MNDLKLVTAFKTMSSGEISELTGKQHSHVLRDIRNMVSELYGDDPNLDDLESKGILFSSDERGYTTSISLDYVHTQTMITGYSISHRKKIIDRWQELERQSLGLPDFTKPAEAARAWAFEYEEKVKALQKIEVDAPKVKFAEAVSDLDGCISIGDLAKLLGTGQNRLFKLLRDEDFLMANNRPYQASLERGLFKVKELPPWQDVTGKTYPSFKTVVTGKGQLYFQERFQKEPWAMRIIQH